MPGACFTVNPTWSGTRATISGSFPSVPRKLPPTRAWDMAHNPRYEWGHSSGDGRLPRQDVQLVEMWPRDDAIILQCNIDVEWGRHDDSILLRQRLELHDMKRTGACDELAGDDTHAGIREDPRACTVSYDIRNLTQILVNASLRMGETLVNCWGDRI